VILGDVDKRPPVWYKMGQTPCLLRRLSVRGFANTHWHTK